MHFQALKQCRFEVCWALCGFFYGVHLFCCSGDGSYAFPDSGAGAGDKVKYNHCGRVWWGTKCNLVPIPGCWKLFYSLAECALLCASVSRHTVTLIQGRGFCTFGSISRADLRFSTHDVWWFEGRTCTGAKVEPSSIFPSMQHRALVPCYGAVRCPLDTSTACAAMH